MTTLKIVRRSFIDSLDFLIILEGVEGVRNSHTAVLGGCIHTKSTRRSISWMRVLDNGDDHRKTIIHREDGLLCWMSSRQSLSRAKETCKTSTPSSNQTTAGQCHANRPMAVHVDLFRLDVMSLVQNARGFMARTHICLASFVSTTTQKKHPPWQKLDRKLAPQRLNSTTEPAHCLSEAFLCSCISLRARTEQQATKHAIGMIFCGIFRHASRSQNS